MARRRSERWRSVTPSPASTVSHIPPMTSKSNARPERSIASASPTSACTITRSRSRSDDERGILVVAVGAQLRRVAVVDLARAVEQVRMHAAAGEEPVPADAIAAGRDDRATALAGRARGDADGLAEEQLAADLRRQLGTLAEGVDP